MPKIVDPNQRRSEFISASWNIISEEGFGAVTMRKVATEAGCTTGALTHYFSDRQELLIAALRAAHDAAAARMAVAANAAKSDFDRLEAVIMESLPLDQTRLKEWKVWLAFWSASTNHSQLAHENADRYREWQSAVELLLSPFTESVRYEAELLIALTDGLGLKLARETNDTGALKKMQKECAAIVQTYLNKFKT